MRFGWDPPVGTEPRRASQSFGEEGKAHPTWTIGVSVGLETRACRFVYWSGKGGLVVWNVKITVLNTCYISCVVLPPILLFWSHTFRTCASYVCKVKSEFVTEVKNGEFLV